MIYHCFLRQAGTTTKYLQLHTRVQVPACSPFETAAVAHATRHGYSPPIRTHRTHRLIRSNVCCENTREQDTCSDHYCICEPVVIQAITNTLHHSLTWYMFPQHSLVVLDTAVTLGWDSSDESLRNNMTGQIWYVLISCLFVGKCVPETPWLCLYLFRLISAQPNNTYATMSRCNQCQWGLLLYACFETYG